MVARTPPKQQRKLTALAPLDTNLIRETVKKVDQCMARLQELQYTVTGGNKVVSGVSLSPRSTRAYLKTSLRCKQESIRIRGGGVASRKYPLSSSKVSATATGGGDWRRMSLPAMLVGETVGEILRASKFAKDIAETVSQFSAEDPKTPLTTHAKQPQVRRQVLIPTTTAHSPSTTLASRRKREKQQQQHRNHHHLLAIRSETGTCATTPSSTLRRRARSRINFKISPGRDNPAAKIEHESSSIRCSAVNRVSPRHRPWAKKTVLFPNPLFNESPRNTQSQRLFCKTKSPVIGRKKKEKEETTMTTLNQNQTPHRFLIKSPPSPRSRTKFQVRIKSPVKVVTISPPPVESMRPRAASPLRAAASKLRRSLSPARLVNRLASPLIVGGGSSRTGAGAGALVQRPLVVTGPPRMVAVRSNVRKT